MPVTVLVTGVGLVTAVGLDAAQSCASARAQLSRTSPTGFLARPPDLSTESEAIVAALAPVEEAGIDRLRALMLRAVDDLLLTSRLGRGAASEDAATPAFPEEGIVLVAPRGTASLRDDEPLWVCGALRLPRSELSAFRGNVLRAVALVVRGDFIACWSIAGSEVVLHDDLWHDHDHVLGAFNVELRSELGLPAEPARLWASAAVLGHRSEVLDLELTP